MPNIPQRGAIWVQSFWPTTVRSDPEPWLMLLAHQATAHPPLARQLAILDALGKSHHPLTAEALIEQIERRLGACLGDDPGQTLRLDIRALRQSGADIRYRRSETSGYSLKRLPGRLSPQAMRKKLGPVDWGQIEALGQVSAARRVRTMLESQALVKANIRARLRKQFPHLSPCEIGTRIVAELKNHDNQ